MDKTKIIAFLSRVDLFKSLSDEYKSLLADRLEQKEYEPDDVIVRPGDAGDSMYMIVRGLVSVLQVDEELGLETELARLYPGQVFGEMALLTGEPRSATCKAVEPTTALMLTDRVLNSLMKRVPQISITLCQILARRLAEVNQAQGTRILDVNQMIYNQEVYELVPEALLKRHKVIPLILNEDALTVATPDPNNLMAMDDIRRCVQGVQIKPILISDADYHRFLERYRQGDDPGLQPPPSSRAAMSARSTTGAESATTRARPSTPERRSSSTAGASRLSTMSGKFQAAKVPLRYAALESESGKAQQQADPGDPVELFDDVVREALDLEASDIHVEPLPDRVAIRYRVDGQLRVRDSFVPRAMYRPLMSRIKLLASLNISERRLPQDGRISLMIGQRHYDMRLNTMPTVSGEKAVLRVLDTQTGLKPLEELVVAEQVCKLIKRMVNLPYGMVLVCGPAGSGKTTTLYASLNERSNPQTNVTTVEDPVEYNLPGINQVQVNTGVGLDFPMVLRGVLRQNPDVILVGETRDVETAKIALEAGLVGHLVLTSFHANTAAGALIRLMEMGMDPFTIAYAINGVVSQRLVRRLCPACAKPTTYDTKTMALLDRSGILPASYDKPLMGANGCDKCRGSGYRGRIAVFEVMTATDAVREALRDRSSIRALSEAASKSGYVSIKRYAAYLLTNGLTTPEQILRLGNTSEHKAVEA